MKNKVFGILTPILTVTFLIGIGILLAVTNNSSDGWAAIGALIMMFMLTGIILIIMFIAALVVYLKKKSDYALGILFGLIGLFSSGAIIAIISSILNFAS